LQIVYNNLSKAVADLKVPAKRDGDVGMWIQSRKFSIEALEMLDAFVRDVKTQFPALNFMRLNTRFFFFAEDVSSAMKRKLRRNMLFIEVDDVGSLVFVNGGTAGGVAISTSSVMKLLTAP
jgi:hypothetical protein